MSESPFQIETGLCINTSPGSRLILAGISSLVLTPWRCPLCLHPLFLPVMRDQIGLNDALGGWIPTFNDVGFVLHALIAASIRKSVVTEEREHQGRARF